MVIIHVSSLGAVARAIDTERTKKKRQKKKNSETNKRIDKEENTMVLVNDRSIVNFSSVDRNENTFSAILFFTIVTRDPLVLFPVRWSMIAVIDHVARSLYDDRNETMRELQ